MEANDIKDSNNITAGIKLNIPYKPREEMHRVKNGETINSIAMLYKVNVQELITINRIGNANLISPGQELIIPKKEKNFEKNDKIST